MENDIKSDHELILSLKQEIEDLTKNITQTEKNNVGLKRNTTSR